ncbi:WXG100 family type VII secretion target [Blastococcus sp. SYSU D00669]
MKVDIATLQHMAGQCRTEAADATGRQAALSAGINTSVLDGWTDSQAAARFTELYEQWRLSAQGVADALNGMGGLLSNVASSYQQHEADMAARIGALL